MSATAEEPLGEIGDDITVDECFGKARRDKQSGLRPQGSSTSRSSIVFGKNRSPDFTPVIIAGVRQGRLIKRRQDVQIKVVLLIDRSKIKVTASPRTTQ
jgi:hypothetical protein